MYWEKLKAGEGGSIRMPGSPSSFGTHCGTFGSLLCLSLAVRGDRPPLFDVFSSSLIWDSKEWLDHWCQLKFLDIRFILHSIEVIPYFYKTFREDVFVLRLVFIFFLPPRLYWSTELGSWRTDWFHLRFPCCRARIRPLLGLPATKTISCPEFLTWR